MINLQINVRKQKEQDQQAVLHLIRQAFWNLYQPGANEHYLYTLIKKSQFFIPQLCLIAESKGNIIGQIIAYKTKIIAQNHQYETITFGPVSVSLQYQGQGIGQYLIKQFFAKAKQIGYKIVIIQGHPHYYKKIGFEDSKKFHICDEEGKFSYGLLIYQLQQGYLHGKNGKYINQVQCQIDPEQLQKFDLKFPLKQKFKTKSQALFQKIISLSQEDDEPPQGKNDRWNRQKQYE